MELPEDTLSAFEQVETVPHGAIIRIGRHSRSLVRWYDPLAVSPVTFKRDQDYVEAANALLAEAVGHARSMGGTQGIALSGGLDSALVCAELLSQLPPGQRMKSFTFHPLAEWDGRVAPHKFGDDRPYVAAFAEMYPALDPVYIDNGGIGLDDRAEQIFLACDAGYPARVTATVYHGVLEAAREHGCDWLLTAGYGNLTFSSSAVWAYCEFLRTGQWRQLWQLAASRLEDPRPMWRRIAAHAVMPQLPAAIRNRIRAIVHGTDGPDPFANSFLSSEGRLGSMRRSENLRAGIMEADHEESREAYLLANYHGSGLGLEQGHGDEQVFGVRTRDVTAYRPLIEFCNGLPTGQFVRNGETRWLARRMGIGRLPEAQRTNRLYGEHNVDWHARLTPRLADLRMQVEAIARHPGLGELIDTSAMLQTLDNWPERTPLEPAQAARLRFFLPAVLHIARYVDFETGRNPP